MNAAPPNTPTDAELVARCRAGEAQGWSLLVQRYQRLVYTIVMRMGQDEYAAADVFQTVFMRLLKHLPNLTQPERLQAWIVTTAKREALRQRELGQRYVSMSQTDDDDESDGAAQWDAADDAATPDEALAEVQELNQLRGALEKLGERCQKLLKLLFHDDDERVAYDEVARLMDMPVGSIGPSRARCLAKLRALWASETGAEK